MVASGVVAKLSIIGGRWLGDTSAAAVARGLADVVVGSIVCEQVIPRARAERLPAPGLAVRAVRR